jgi:hypothetical protein
MISFRCYDPSSDGSGGIHAWYRGLSPTFQAQIDSALEDLALERDLESAAIIEELHGACEGLLEAQIDFGPNKRNQIHVRILGFEWPRRRIFAMLVGFQKTPENISYGPHCRSALGHKDGVLKDGQRAKRCHFP